MPKKLTGKFILLRLIPSLVTGLVLFSCSTSTTNEKIRAFPEYDVWMDSLLLTKNKAVRGIEPGSSVDTIRKIEKCAPSEEDSTSLYFEFKLDSNSSYSVSYSIEEGKAQEIEILITSRNVDRVSEIYSSLKEYFTSKYAAPISEKGINIFSGLTSSGENLKISLQDVSDLQEGKIAILVYLEN
jgi:hypothetical protein